MTAQAPDDADVEAVRERIDKASEVVAELCQGKRRWTMSVPARPNNDPDLLIESGLDAGREVLAALDAARARCAEMEKGRDWWLAVSDHETMGRNRNWHAWRKAGRTIRRLRAERDEAKKHAVVTLDRGEPVEAMGWYNKWKDSQEQVKYLRGMLDEYSKEIECLKDSIGLQ